MRPDLEIELALDILRKKFYHINYRQQEGVRLMPMEQFLFELIPALEALLKESYHAFHDVLMDDEHFEAHHRLELEVARAIIRSDIYA